MDLCPEFGAHYTFPHRRTRQCYVPARESPRARIRTGCRMPHLPTSGSANAAMAHASSRAGQFFRLPPWLAEARHSSSGQPSGNGPVLPYAVVQCHGEGLWRKRPVVQPGKHSLYAVRAKCRIPEAVGFLRLVGKGQRGYGLQHAAELLYGIGPVAPGAGVYVPGRPRGLCLGGIQIPLRFHLVHAIHCSNHRFTRGNATPAWRVQ